MADEVTPQEGQEPTSERNPLLEGQDFDDSPEVSGDSPETPETPEAPDPLARYRELGFENVESPEEANERLMQAYRQQMADVQSLLQQQEELKTLAQYGNQYLQQLQ